MVNWNLRFGLFRRNRRNYSLHLRKYGKNALDRLQERHLVKLKQMLLKLLFVSVGDDSQSELCEMSLIAYVYTSLQLNAITSPHFGFVDHIPKERISVRSFTPQKLEEYTGFNSLDIKQLMIHLGVPEYFTLNSGSNFCIFL